jgi:aspartate/tyrosine/aromatic aminotransferase
VLDCIRAAEKIIVERKMDHEYGSIQGCDIFLKNSLKLMYGENNPIILND